MSSRIELLHAYHDGELGRFDRWRVRRLLARDAEARRELEALAAVRRAVRDSWEEPPAPDVWAGLEGRLRAVDAEREGTTTAPSPWGLPSLLRPAAAGALLAALVAGVALFLGPEPSSGGGVVRWLDTHGQAVMVLDQGDATIIWLMQPDADQAGRWGTWLGLI